MLFRISKTQEFLSKGYTKVSMLHLTKRLVERTLEAEMSGHLGYDKGGKSHRSDGNTLWRQEPKDGYQRF